MSKWTWQSIFIYIIALILLYSTSLQGQYLVGTDIHSEYYISSRMYNGWDINYPHLYNASISTAIIAPFISKVTGISLIWVYKAIYPALFALVPVILYFAYKKMIGRTPALIASAFFISMPAFFLELPQLPRQELAELLFCLTILVIVYGSKKWIWSIIPLLMFTVIIHYTIGMMALAFLICMMVVKLVGYKWKWNVLQNSNVPFRVLLIAIVCVGLLSLVWGLNVASGLSLRALSNIANVSVNEQVIQGTQPIDIDNVVNTSDGITSTALGLDIIGGNISGYGAVFRIIQIITQVLIIVGCFSVLIRYKYYKWNSEFVASIGGSLMLLLLCIVVFGFSGLLGITRFYHVALIFLAPMLSISLDVFSRRKGSICGSP